MSWCAFTDKPHNALASYAALKDTAPHNAGSHRYYIKQDEWQSYLEEAIERAIRPASVEVMEGKLKASAIAAQLNRENLIEISNKLLELTYHYPVKNLPRQIDKVLADLPGGKEWFDYL